MVITAERNRLQNETDFVRGYERKKPRLSVIARSVSDEAIQEIHWDCFAAPHASLGASAHRNDPHGCSSGATDGSAAIQEATRIAGNYRQRDPGRNLLLYDESINPISYPGRKFDSIKYEINHTSVVLISTNGCVEFNSGRKTKIKSKS